MSEDVFESVDESVETSIDLEHLFTEFEDAVIKSENIDEMSMLYRMAYDDVEELNRQLKIAAAKKAKLAESFCKILLENGLRSVKTKDGTFGPKVEPQISIIKGSEERAFAVLEECGHGGVIKRKVEWQTLNKLFRDDEDLKQSVAATEDVFKTWEKHGIKIRRANGT